MLRFLNNHFRRPKSRSSRTQRTRLCVEQLESRLALYAVSGNAWLNPHLVPGRGWDRPVSGAAPRLLWSSGRFRFGRSVYS